MQASPTDTRITGCTQGYRTNWFRGNPGAACSGSFEV